MARYERIADDLRVKILGGALAPGDRLPAETELAAYYDVGVPTVRHALNVLRDQDLIHKRHGSGNFVLSPHPRVPYIHDERGLVKQTAEGATVTRVDVKEMTADGQIAALMGVPVGTQLVEWVCLSHQRDRPPHSLVRAYVPGALASLLPADEISRSPWGTDLRDRLLAADIELHHTEERVIARPPTVEETEPLGIAAGTPVLAIERRSIDTSGRTVEAAILVLPGDRAEAVYTTPAPTDADTTERL